MDTALSTALPWSPRQATSLPAGARPVPVALALQGGGSLGAFSWGVLDRLLDEPRLRVAVASGASAGAMNAAMLVQGLATGGPAEAKRLLEVFWACCRRRRLARPRRRSLASPVFRDLRIRG